MKWFKHSCLSSKDIVQINLLRLYSFAGLGLFWYLKEMICLNEGSYPLSSVLSIASSKLTKKEIIDIIYNICKGYFEVDDKQYIHATEKLQKELCLTCTGAADPAADPAGDPADAGYIKSLLEEKREEKNILMMDPAVAKIIQELKDNNSDIWRESLSTQVDEYDLIIRHWEWCIDYFAHHVASIENKINDLSDARRYFVFFVRGYLTTKRFYKALHKHDKIISSLNEDSSEEERKAFNEYMTVNCPRLAKMESPLTINEYRMLRKSFQKEEVKDVLNAMENTADIETKYLSCYHTAMRWLKRRQQ